MGADKVREGTATSAETPQPHYTDTITATAIACGEMHTCVKTKDDDVFSFGHSANGRLGIGTWDNDHQTTPLPVHMPTSEVVALIACGSEHKLMMCTQSLSIPLDVAMAVGSVVAGAKAKGYTVCHKEEEWKQL